MRRGILETITTIVVADPRPVFQKLIEHAVGEYGFETTGQPDLVLTPDSRSTQTWSERRVPVVTYEDEDDVDMLGLMVTVVALVDP